MSINPLLLAVDGGGTKTAVWLGTPDAQTGEVVILSKIVGGPSNLRATGWEQSRHNLERAIAQVFAEAQCKVRRAEHACFCLAGAGRSEEREILMRWNEQSGIASDLQIVGDAETLLACVVETQREFDSLQGVALVAGTGSIAWGKNSSQQARSGGWGHVLGDEGSGFAIAQAGLQAACRAADGREGSELLLDEFMRQLGLSEPSQLVAWVHDDLLFRERVAAMAGVVFECCKRDPSAERIIERAADELAEMVVAVAHKLKLEGFALACTGGVLLAQREFYERLVRELEQREIGLQTAQLIEQPVLGALKRAAWQYHAKAFTDDG